MEKNDINFLHEIIDDVKYLLAKERFAPSTSLKKIWFLEDISKGIKEVKINKIVN